MFGDGSTMTRCGTRDGTTMETKYCKSCIHSNDHLVDCNLKKYNYYDVFNLQRHSLKTTFSLLVFAIFVKITLAQDAK